MSPSRLTARTSRASIALLAALAYLPALFTKPGRMPADTKLYLYLNPGRLISDAPNTWDVRQFGGWVPHQVIAYLWPQGPWYWVMEKIGAPDWVAQRLWIGTLLFVGALGVLWAARLLGLDRRGATTAAVVYQLSPYVLPYISRTSAMLLPWAAVGWLVALTIKTATSQHRWRYAALTALVVLSCSAVNATAVMMIAPAPVLWLVHAAVERTITWRRVFDTAARIGALSLGVSVWWIAMLRAQGTYGADVLAYSESLQATSLTSSSTETLRGMGYWLAYVRDPYAFTTTAARVYMESGRAIITSLAIVVLCLAGLALTRWRQRRYAALLVFVGIVLAVGVHPIDNSSPLMQPLAEHSRSSLSLALRSSTRALPLSNFGLALGIGALVTALLATRVRWRALAPALVVLLAVANLPALFDGGLVDPALERDQTPPSAWLHAADALSATSSEYRVMQLPGSEFGAFRWGYTVDPPLPGLTTKPLITRDLLPLGSPGVMDLLYALDDRIQQGILEPTSVAPVARYLGVDTVWVPNDLAFDRFRTPHPVTINDILTRRPAGLGAPTSYGTPAVNTPTIPMVDEHALTDGADATKLPPVQLVPVLHPQPIVRASSDVVELAGSGDGVVDAAAAGLLQGDEAVRYAADSATRTVGAAPSRVILTDSNRDRAHHWRSSQDVTGFTERGTPTSDVVHPDEADQRLPVFGLTPNPADQTIATLDDGLTVSASGYGEPFAYRPEQRPAMAVDGDPATAWVVGDRTNPIGEFITVSKASGQLSLLQADRTNATSIASRMITRVQLRSGDGHTAEVALDASSLVGTGQRVRIPGSGSLTITILAVAPRPGGTDTGPSAVGFAELGIGRHVEVVRTPRLPADLTASTPLDIVLTRLRVDPMNRWRSDPEPSLVRQFTTPGPRTFDATVTLQGSHRASDPVLATIDHTQGAMASARLTGDVNSRGIYATDGDPRTAWTSPFGSAVGLTLTVPLDGSPMSSLRLQQRIDTLHSRITKVRIDIDGTTFDLDVAAPDVSGTSTLHLPSPVVGHRMVLTVLATDARTTVDRRFAEITELPVSIRELSAPPIQPSTRLEGDLAPFCSKGLVTLDGADLDLAMTQTDITTLADGGTVTVHPCTTGTVAIGAGTHRLSTLDGLSTGIDVDRVVFTAGTSTAAANPTVALTRTLTTRTATVSPCPAGCWLIFGEGLNLAWTASVSGHSLGSPQQVAGGFNGWWLPPTATATAVRIEWTAQRAVDWALAVSALFVLLCIALVVKTRRPATVAAPEWVSTPPSLSRRAWQPQTLVSSILAALTVVAVTALVAAPSTAVYALVPAVAIVVLRRPRVGAVAAALLMSLLSLRILQRQLVNRFPANAAWPGFFEKLHRPGMMVVALLVVAVLFDRDR